MAAGPAFTQIPTFFCPNRSPAMTIYEAIVTRRSVKEFTERPVTREEIERLLDVVVHAPNHRLTEPWRFYVLGPAARRAYGAVLGGRKARRIEDAEAAAAVLEKVAERHARLPAMLVVSVILDDNPEIREEDFAAVYMGIQNLSLVAGSMGLGTHLKTGAVMDDPGAREVVGVPEGERIVCVVEVGEPARVPDAKPRRSASESTTWVG